jgi:hypothetical protein
MRSYNSLGGKRETFTNTGDPVKLYVCGITPYAATHLGHIFTYSASDVLARHLKYQGFSGRYVQNLTDIDDPHDLDTPRALAIVEALADETVASDTTRSEVSEVLRELGNVLGLRLSGEPDDEVRGAWDRHLSDLGKDS